MMMGTVDIAREQVTLSQTACIWFLRSDILGGDLIRLWRFIDGGMYRQNRRRLVLVLYYPTLALSDMSPFHG